MDNKVKTVEQWIMESDGVIFRYQVYRKIYTPYEQQNASMLESQFESVKYNYGYIENIVPLGGGDWLIGFRDIYCGIESGIIRYYRLSEIRLEFCEDDQNIDEEEED